MTEYSLDSSPSKPETAVCRYFVISNCVKGDTCQFTHSTSASPDNHFTMEQREREQNDDDHILDIQLNQTFDTDPVEASVEDVVEDYDSTLVGDCGSFVDARTDGCDAYVSSSRETVDDSWSQESGGSIFEMTARLRPEDWVMAAEFVPGQKWQSRSLANAYDSEIPMTLPSEGDVVLLVGNEDAFGEIPKVCPDLLMDNIYVSQDVNPMLDGPVPGELCDLCQDVVLSALTEEDRQKHITECIENHEKEMERSFAIQRSQEKSCGICMDIVWEKAVISEQRFGILSNCSHVFCLACIRKWRSAKQFENKIVRACPECRIKSDFVIPSRYWVEDKDDKKKLIEEYKLALSKKPCKYFDKGRGECPFNEKCFYLHALPDGRVASPKPVFRRRRPTAASSQTESNTSHMVLYEILDDWPLNHWEDLIFHLNFFELSLLSTSDEEDDDGEDDFDDSDLSGVM